LNIIQGSKLDRAKASVEPGAYIIDGNHYENLVAVLNGEVRTCKVVEGPDSQIRFFHGYINDDVTWASLVIKTAFANGKRERYHTIQFVRQPGGEWKIKSWHVSG
jgi:hypothetical protein